MKHLSIDIETRSGADITKTGSYRYAQDPDFQILLFAYKIDYEDVQIIDFTNGESLPEEIRAALEDPAVIKHAYNAAFEWYCLNRAGFRTPIEQWRCTMFHAMYCAMPAGLAATGTAIGLPEDKKKLSVGRALIKYFCTPQRETKKFHKKYHDPADDPGRWNLFKDYCKQDVTAEFEILQRLKAFPVPELEEKRWQQDILRNANGVRVDRQLIRGALSINAETSERLSKRAKELTGLDNPNSPAQLKQWITDRTGREITALRKEDVTRMLAGDIPEDVREVLHIRQQAGKTSVKKYDAMRDTIGEGDRIRGLLQFYGAPRTGRWSGRLVQMQNLHRNYLSTLDIARKITRQGNGAGLELIYGNVPDTLAQLIRTAFIPSEGRHFVVTDFSAIEARVIAWLAGEKWVQKVFADGGDIYCATASQMFGVPVEKHGVNGDLRQKGKVATLALGYNGGPGALIQMGALDMGLREDELPDIVRRWRLANPHICKLWRDMEQAAIHTVQTAEDTCVRGITFRLEGDLIYGLTFLTMQLPSGRKLHYQDPVIKEGKFGNPALSYMGQTNHAWVRTDTYGGRLCENCIQGIARDCLAEAVDRMEEKGWDIVMMIHDEVVIDAPPEVTLAEANAIMAEPIAWAPGLILKGDGFEGDYYRKE